MNLIEAIKSGRPFRRVNYPEWFSLNDHPAMNDSVIRMNFSRKEILADDWEIQEPTVTITRTQFWFAYHWATGNSPHDIGWSLKDYAAALARKLGLEP